MKRISIRELLRDFSSSVSDLPVMITKYGRDFCVIIDLDTYNEIADYSGVDIEKLRKEVKELKNLIEGYNDF